MGTTYTKAEILTKVNEWLTPENVSLLYAQEFVNYTGVTSDTREKYTEVIAAHLLDKLSVFEKIEKIPREKSYNVGHEPKEFDFSSTRKEEQVARSFMGHAYNYIGKVIDYQTPLKNVQRDDAGKIDLLSWNEAERCAYILELKTQDSDETLLRCILEIDTYRRIVDAKKLLFDFELPTEASVRKAALIYRHSRPRTHFCDSNINVRKLMKKLRVDLFVLDQDNKVVEAYYWEELEG